MAAPSFVYDRVGIDRAENPATDADLDLDAAGVTVYPCCVVCHSCDCPGAAPPYTPTGNRGRIAGKLNHAQRLALALEVHAAPVPLAPLRDVAAVRQLAGHVDTHTPEPFSTEGRTASVLV